MKTSILDIDLPGIHKFYVLDLPTDINMPKSRDNIQVDEIVATTFLRLIQAVINDPQRSVRNKISHINVLHAIAKELGKQTINPLNSNNPLEVIASEIDSFLNTLHTKNLKFLPLVRNGNAILERGNNILIHPDLFKTEEDLDSYTKLMMSSGEGYLMPFNDSSRAIIILRNAVLINSDSREGKPIIDINNPLILALIETCLLDIVKSEKMGKASTKGIIEF